MERESYMSFVVRLWCETSDSAWRGEVEHIQTGYRWNFGSLPHLLDFLRLATETPYVLANLYTSEDTPIKG